MDKWVQCKGVAGTEKVGKAAFEGFLTVKHTVLLWGQKPQALELEGSRLASLPHCSWPT